MLRSVRPVWIVSTVALTAFALLALATQKGAAGSLLPHGYCFTYPPCSGPTPTHLPPYSHPITLY